MSAKVKIYSTRACPFCNAAKQLLAVKNVEFEDIPVDGNSKLREEMTKLAGQHTVPQIWIGEQHVGGYTDLAALQSSGKLDALLNG